jgi:hypothetical protein
LRPVVPLRGFRLIRHVATQLLRSSFHAFRTARTWASEVNSVSFNSSSQRRALKLRVAGSDVVPLDPRVNSRLTVGSAGRAIQSGKKLQRT